MTDHAELIERLRAYRAYCPNTDRADHPICNEAADRIAALVAERDALREAMQRVHTELDEYIDQNSGEVRVSVALAFEVARAALAQGGEP